MIPSLNKEEVFTLASEKRDSPPIILIHGASSCHETWIEQWHFLRNTNHVIIPDLPGHNNSCGEGFNRIESYAEAVHELIKKLSIGKFVLAGHSMGGAIAQLFALTHPQMLKGLILVSTGARLRVAQSIFKAIDENFSSFAELSANFSVFPAADERIKKRIVELIQKCKPAVARKDFEACDNFDIMDRVSGIKSPTLIICGDMDMVTPLKYSQYLHGKIENASLEIIKNAGHIVMLEKPGEVNRAIANFLKNIG